MPLQWSAFKNNAPTKESTMLSLLLGFMAATADAPFYANKLDLLFYADAQGALRPVTTAAGWESRRAHLLANMQRVMGPMPPDSAKVPLDVQVLEETDCGSCLRRKITYASESWDRVPAYLFLPKKTADKAAAVLCLHPTSELGKGIVAGLGGLPHRNYAVELAERGYVTLAPDYPGFGDYQAARKALYEHGYVSCTMKGIWNHRRALDLLQSLPEADPERIGCIGHSLGGHNTLFLGVFDPRVKVMVTSCGFTLFAKYYQGDLTGWTHDGYMPRIAETYGKDPAKMPFDFPEILAALAPRHVFINAPLHDANFEVSGVRDCVGAARTVFALYGADDHLETAYPDAEHDFPDAVREQAYAFMDHALGR
jgi:dienelactone hydrolase